MKKHIMIISVCFLMFITRVSLAQDIIDNIEEPKNQSQSFAESINNTSRQMDNNYEWRKSSIWINSITNPFSKNFPAYRVYFAGKLMQETMQYLYNTGEIINSSFNTYTYDSNGKLSSITYQSYLENGKRENAAMESYQYNANGKTSNYSYLVWQNQKWDVNTNTNYMYNTSNELVEASTERNLNGSYVPYSKTSYLDYKNGKYSEILSQIYSSGSWNNSYKYTFNRDAVGNILQQNTMSWNSTSNTWDDMNVFTYTYDSQGNMLTKTMKTKSGAEWIYYYYQYNYDSYNNLLREEELDYQQNPKYQISYEYGLGEFLQIITPQSSETLKPKQIYYLDWIQNKISKLRIEMTTNNGFNWTEISNNVNTSTPFQWTVPETYIDNCKIKIINAQYEQIFSISNSFKIDIPFLNHITKNISLSIFNNGSFGQDNLSNTGIGLTFSSSSNVLYSGGISFGNQDKGISGMIGSFQFYDMTNKNKMKNFYSNNYFNQITSTTISDNNSSNKYGVEVLQESYSNTKDDFVFIKYTLQNVSGNVLSNFYLGMFADWDINDAQKNLGGYIKSRNLVYEYDNSSKLYFGIVALNGMAGGKVTGESGNRNDLFTYFKNTTFDVLNTETDYRSFISSGPFNISNSSKVSACFAVVGGNSYDSFLTNVDQVISVYNNGVVGIENNRESLPMNYALYQNYPNPFNPATKIKFDIPKTTNVRITIYDVLGREIEMLTNNEMTAGKYEIDFTAKNIASGIYFYQIKTNDFLQTKKFILLK